MSIDTSAADFPHLVEKATVVDATYPSLQVFGGGAPYKPYAIRGEDGVKRIVVAPSRARVQAGQPVTVVVHGPANELNALGGPNKLNVSYGLVLPSIKDQDVLNSLLSNAREVTPQLPPFAVDQDEIKRLMLNRLRATSTFKA
jgi:hypothetical protein